MQLHTQCTKNPRCQLQKIIEFPKTFFKTAICVSLAANYFFTSEIAAGSFVKMRTFNFHSPSFPSYIARCHVVISVSRCVFWTLTRNVQTRANHSYLETNTSWNAAFISVRVAASSSFVEPLPCTACLYNRSFSILAPKLTASAVSRFPSSSESSAILR